jgi:hypothetical protein
MWVSASVRVSVSDEQETVNAGAIGENYHSIDCPHEVLTMMRIALPF